MAGWCGILRGQRGGSCAVAESQRKLPIRLYRNPLEEDEPAPEAPIIPPPSTLTVFEEPSRPLLFDADGVPMPRRRAGF